MSHRRKLRWRRRLLQGRSCSSTSAAAAGIAVVLRQQHFGSGSCGLHGSTLLSASAASAADLNHRRLRLPRQVFGFGGCGFLGRSFASTAADSAAGLHLWRLRLSPLIFILGGFCFCCRSSFPGAVAFKYAAAAFRFRRLRRTRQPDSEVFGIGGCGFLGRSSALASASSADSLRLPWPVFGFGGCGFLGRPSSSMAVALAAGLRPWRPRLRWQVFIRGGCAFRGTGGSSSSAAAVSSSSTTPADDNRGCDFDVHRAGCLDDLGATDGLALPSIPLFIPFPRPTLPSFSFPLFLEVCWTFPFSRGLLDLLQDAPSKSWPIPLHLPPPYPLAPRLIRQVADPRPARFPE
jgi:hypothetical protein